jgi:hypothetical protein
MISFENSGDKTGLTVRDGRNGGGMEANSESPRCLRQDDAGKIDETAVTDSEVNMHRCCHAKTETQSQSAPTPRPSGPGPKSRPS